MDRNRFEQLLAAYGADLNRWPAGERAAAAAFKAARGGEIAAALEEARALDEALDLMREPAPDAQLLAARILKAVPKAQERSFGRRARAALAACAVFGVIAGYGAGLLAPAAAADDGVYLAMAFEAFGEGG